eukprot:CAMPEP_0173237880 /NCGR_PEP_ID=MMETSP1142-20121109/12312_1 /TAXON_ID=483371 /ORGANISM="non described non described, Strain CCMP2298" /LENGTH=86 /DNA_ID=CAMNT_0014168651 /DNA_START=280 /DNA_END=540 /DNA_ORIENTATION=+
MRILVSALPTSTSRKFSENSGAASRNFAPLTSKVPVSGLRDVPVSGLREGNLGGLVTASLQRVMRGGVDVAEHVRMASQPPGVRNA